uniref:SFRICE_021988 n=1 Tax=Spodoptera frugiperda TaxID=7108 RepID=A0A2H1WEF0_SPOFR
MRRHLRSAPTSTRKTRGATRGSSGLAGADPLVMHVAKLVTASLDKCNCGAKGFGFDSRFGKRE